MLQSKNKSVIKMLLAAEFVVAYFLKQKVT